MTRSPSPSRTPESGVGTVGTSYFTKFVGATLLAL